jgi:hypothetical protein
MSTGLLLLAALSGFAKLSDAQGGPPPQAISACSGQTDSSPCSFAAPRGVVSGSCYTIRGQLACVPNGAPRPPAGGGPPDGGGPSNGGNGPPQGGGGMGRSYSQGGGSASAGSPGVIVESASKEEIQSAVSEAVKEAIAQQGGSKPVGTVRASDVDRPSYMSSEKPHNFALVVGISKYSNVPDADFADRDALAVRKHLLAMGYPDQNIIMLVGEKATMGALSSKLETWLPKNVDEKSTVFVYFSGHGAPDVESKEAYLVPWDGDPESLPNTALPLSRLYGDLNKLKARRVLVALDACFSGAGGRSVLPKGAKPLLTKVDTGTAALGKLVVFTASEAGQISGTLEDQRHGTFTYYFLKGLNGAAYVPNQEGHVTAGSLFTYLAPRVDAAAHRHSRDQRPQLLPSPEKSADVELR